MIRLRSHTATVVTVDSRGLRIAEVRLRGAEAAIARSDRFDLPDALDWQKPQAAAALTTFLRQGRWKGSRAILGLSAEQCLFNAQTLPAIQGDALGDAIAIQAERLFGASAIDLVIDHTPPSRNERGLCTLLAATTRGRMNTVVDGLAGAGVKVDHATAGILALVGREPGDDAWIGLHVTDADAELAVVQGGHPVSVAHIGFRGEAELATLERELRQVVLLLPDGGGRVVLWNDSNIDSPAISTVAERLGLTCQTRQRRGAAGGPGDHVVTSLAELARRAARPPVDFLHPRIGAKPPRRIGRRTLWAVAVVATMVLAGVSLALDMLDAARDVEMLSSRLSDMSEDLERAQAMVDQTELARQWFARQPRYLECQRSLAEAFGEDGNVWAKSIAIQDDMTGSLTGNGVNERNVLELLDRLKKLPEMASVKLMYVRETGGRSDDVGFAIRFALDPIVFDPNRTRP